MKFIQSTIIALIGVASVSATLEVPTCMKACNLAAQKASGCGPKDVLCLCSPGAALVSKVAACGITACKDDTEFGAGMRAVTTLCEAATAHHEILRRNAPELFAKREIDEESCKRCAESKHASPPVLTPTVPHPNGTYPNATIPGLTPGGPSRTRHLPKAPTGAGSAVTVTTGTVIAGLVLSAFVL